MPGFLAHYTIDVRRLLSELATLQSKELRVAGNYKVVLASVGIRWHKLAV